MPSFILRDLNPEFWSKVQAKAKAEGTTVKAVILQLLTQWLGVLALALFTVGCHTYVPEPLAPSPVVAVVEPTPTPAPTVTPLSVSLSIGRSDLEVGDGVSFTASAGSAITRADWAFGNGATASSTNGDAGYTYPAPGTFVVRVIVTVADGRTGTAQQTVTVKRKTSTPAPTPPPTPTPTAPSLAVTETCSEPVAPSTTTACNVATTYGGAALPSTAIVDSTWDWGGGSTETVSGPTAQHTFTQAGTWIIRVTVRASTVDGIQTGSATASVSTGPPIAPTPVTPPTLAVTLNCTAPIAPARVTFCNVSASYGGTPLLSTAIVETRWDWGVGTGTVVAGPATSHDYALTPGTWVVVVDAEVQTSDGIKFGRATKTVIIP